MQVPSSGLLVACKLQVMRHADRAQPHIRMAQHDALGPAGRTTGVEDGRQGVRIVRGWPCMVALRFGQREDIGFVDRRTRWRQVRVLQRGQPCPGPDQQHRAAVGNNLDTK